MHEGIAEEVEAPGSPRPVGRGAIVAVVLALAALAAAGSASARQIVRGAVTDSVTGLPLAGATVQVQGTLLGTVTNVEGRFALAAAGLPVRLEVRFIGYRSRTVRVDRLDGEPVAIRLEPDVVELGNLTVTSENLAVGIVRRAVARKQTWQDSIRSAYAEAYTRFILMREFDPVRVEETIAALWWTLDGGTREIVRAERTRPATTERFRFLEPVPVPNLYDDTIVIDRTQFVGPLHPDGPSVYAYDLTGRRVRDGRTVYDIAYVPLRATAAAFSGMLAVEDSTFDVLEIHARPAVDRLGPPPVRERALRMQQTFARVGSAMQPVGFRAEGHVRLGMPGAAYPTARFTQVSGLTLHVLDVVVPDSLFESSVQRRFAPDAQVSGWLFDWNPGWVPPSEAEARAMERVSTARSLSASFRPEGLLRQYLAVNVTEDRTAGAVLDPPRIEWRRPWIWYNRVDGWQVGLRPRIRVAEGWTVAGGAGYAEARGGVPWSLVTTWTAPVGLAVSLGADELTAFVGEAKHSSRFALGLAAYGGWDDYYDYFARRRGFVRVAWPRGPVHAGVTVQVERDRSVERQDFYRGFLRRNGQRDNPPVEDGLLSSVTLDLSSGDEDLPGVREAAYAGSSLEVARSGVLASDFGFVRWSGAVSARIPVYLVRRRRPATLRVDTYVGLVDRDTPVQREGFLHTAAGPLAPGAGFRVSDTRLPLSRRWFAVFWQHNLGSAPWEAVGLGETTMGMGLFGGHGTASGDRQGFRHELGVFVSDMFGYPVRIYVGSPLDRFRIGATVKLLQSF